MTYALALRWERPPRYWHDLAVDSLFSGDLHVSCSPDGIGFDLCDRAFFVVERLDDEPLETKTA